MADETTRIDQWLTAALLADAQLAAIVGTKVFSGMAPRESTWPVVVFQFLGGSDTATGAGVNRIMHRGVYMVKGVTEGPSYGPPLQTIADRIDAVLHGKPDPGSMIVASVGGASILSSVREQPFRLEEEIDGRHYRSLGGFYRIQAQL
jgi:hypothetical protein